MHATIGTRLVVHGRTTGAPERHGVVTEVGGRDNGPPFTVQWEDGHECVFFPGPDAMVEPLAPALGDRMRAPGRPNP
jgi:Domain of unknown function (DUF1918)